MPGSKPDPDMPYTPPWVHHMPGSKPDPDVPYTPPWVHHMPGSKPDPDTNTKPKSLQSSALVGCYRHRPRSLMKCTFGFTRHYFC